MATIVEELASLMERLPAREQERVLSFARELTQPLVFPRTPRPAGTPGRIVAQLRVSPEIGAVMEQALATA